METISKFDNEKNIVSAYASVYGYDSRYDDLPDSMRTSPGISAETSNYIAVSCFNLERHSMATRRKFAMDIYLVCGDDEMHVIKINIFLLPSVRSLNRAYKNLMDRRTTEVLCNYYK